MIPPERLTPGEIFDEPASGTFHSLTSPSGADVFHFLFGRRLSHFPFARSVGSIHKGLGLCTRYKDNGALVCSSLHNDRNRHLHGALRHSICYFLHDTIHPNHRDLMASQLESTHHNSRCMSSLYQMPSDPPWARVGDPLFQFESL